MSFNINGKEWTGERLETFVFTENTSEHLHRYAMAVELVKNKSVLDIACGEGYGSHILCATAQSVTGVDIDPVTIKNATEKYTSANLSFKIGSAHLIPCNDSSFDVVVSFETIEHHDKHDEMMREIKRVLKPDGILIISSPDKLHYSDIPQYKNPFHIKELYKEEFERLITRYFKNAAFFGQKSFSGSVIFSSDNTGNAVPEILYSGNYHSLASEKLHMMYCIAIASDASLPALQNSFFDGADVFRKQLQERTDYTRHVATVAVKNTWRYRIGNIILRPFSFFKNLF